MILYKLRNFKICVFICLVLIISGACFSQEYKLTKKIFEGDENILNFEFPNLIIEFDIRSACLTTFKIKEKKFQMYHSSRSGRLVRDMENFVRKVKLKNYKLKKYDLFLINNPGSIEYSKYTYDIKSKDSTVTIKFENKERYKSLGLIIRKTFIVHYKDYVIKLKIEIENITSKDVVIESEENTGFRFILGYGLGQSWLDDKLVYETSSETVQTGISNLTLRDDLNYIGYTDNYFVMAFFSDFKAKYYEVTNEKKAIDGYWLKISSEPIKIYAGKKKTFSFRACLGPKYEWYLNKNGLRELRIKGMIVPYVLIALRMCYKVTRNWGLAIILLTLLIRLILYPLTKKQNIAMKKMQELQPKVMELREKYKGDTQRLNQEVMKLYQIHKVNPFSGCFPLLLQLPILFALFMALRSSIELKGETFLWMKDLSAPDKFLLFPGTTFPLPILPILIAASTYWQMKKTQMQQGQTQGNAMMIWMPILLFFISQTLPSGVLVYWISSTILQVLEQRFIKGDIDNASKRNSS